ncbi:RagB/SusD family nutrient uptake outer membrane protein [Fulvivirgaceae bacterium PWU4]|uniref:RagB/SusD family nutrient uptake outer membrane protein n=1 Tax=Chryseosolibacter histidini TaxID=2782349 RepID=A0AAP2GSH3_9BACT|nr:RagB/SusD family nutrient uptake outer membrane protein [Chryseosolibacter histidini]MBT1700687.1 RagB/SusD family nutrient uptake outer membrane protein [Chryseosolibacter histidini]
MKQYKYIFWMLALLSVVPTGCGDEFLNRPPQDAYVAEEWFKTESQINATVNALYGGVWFDFQRSFINIGDVMAGNEHKGADNPFYTFNVNATTSGISEAYNSLWMAVGYANSVLEGVTKYAPASLDKAVVNRALGEALVWKSMAYFYLVRSFGPVPIIESNSESITDGSAVRLYRNTTADIYEYIVRMLTRAGELLPQENLPGRINRYTAYGLLAKVYLTRSGVGQIGTRKQADLDKAKEYAGMVVNSSLKLEPVYWNLFRISTGNRNPENLLSWHWQSAEAWGSQNAMQADLAVQNLTGFGDGWGTWSGPSINLQQLFGEDATRIGAGNRVTNDSRRKSTMMMDGDFYTDLQRDKPSDPTNANSPKGLKVTWDGGSQFQSPTGAWARKHIVGNAKDNEAEGGGLIAFMKTDLSTHLLRLGDVYLIYAEAILGNNATTSDAEALKALNAVRARSIANHVALTQFNFNDILNERRRELAYEGDNWFDYVRLNYYKPDEAIALLAAQERGNYNGNAATLPITLASRHYTPTSGDFLLPVPEGDLLKNPNLNAEPVAYDFSKMKTLGRD